MTFGTALDGESHLRSGGSDANETRWSRPDGKGDSARSLSGSSIAEGGMSELMDEERDERPCSVPRKDESELRAVCDDDELLPESTRRGARAMIGACTTVSAPHRSTVRLSSSQTRSARPSHEATSGCGPCSTTVVGAASSASASASRSPSVKVGASAETVGASIVRRRRGTEDDVQRI